MVFQGCLTNSYQILRCSPTNILQYIFNIVLLLLSTVTGCFCVFKNVSLFKMLGIYALTMMDSWMILASPLHSFGPWRWDTCFLGKLPSSFAVAGGSGSHQRTWRDEGVAASGEIWMPTMCIWICRFMQIFWIYIPEQYEKSWLIDFYRTL